MLHARTAAIASLTVIASLAAIGGAPGPANAQEVLKLGLIQSLTGAFNTTGKAAVNGALLYLKQHGDTVAGRKIQIITKDERRPPMRRSGSPRT
jgi:branched-chain amino acid transport system substrate-binding protein